MKIKFTSPLTIALIMVLLTFDKTNATAQQDNRKVRIANIQIDPAYVDKYKAALAEHAKDIRSSRTRRARFTGSLRQSASYKGYSF